MENEAEPNDLLRDARIQHHWTQQDLAAKLEVSKDAVRSWEHGRRSPSLEQRAKLCDLFAMSPPELGLESKQRDTVLSELYSDTTPSDLSRMRVNRHRMIGHVKAVWIEGVREQMLHQTTSIMLTLQERPDALANPWGSVVQETNLPSRTLPPDTSLAQIYDEADGNLLLLGEPGAGKTTLLLNLARILLKRAEQNEHHPLPVIFHLAAWAAKQQPLAVWLVEELSTKYHVPRPIGQDWIDHEQLIFLLDGLDEVAPASRSACMRAIEAYQTDQHPLASVVVCCRLVEYYKLPARLTKGRAIALQPLTVEQIDRYLAGAGTPLKMMRQALDQNADLLELVKNPLMLSVVTQVYLNKDAVLLQGSLDLLKQQIFRSYVQRMLSRRAADNRYSQEQIVHWLSWLAMQMQQRNQSEFYVERMQPDLLPVSLRQRYYRTAVQVVCGLESLVLATTLAWLRGGKVTPTLGGVGGGLFGELGGGLGNTVLGWMWPGLGLGGLGGGGVVSLVFALVAVLVGMMIDTGTPRQPLSRHQVRLGITRGIRYGLICAGLVWLFCLLLFGLRGGLTSGLTYSSSFGVLTGLIVGPLSGLTVSLRQRKLTFSPRRSVRAKLSRMGDGIIPGICALLGFWIVNALLKLQDGFVYGFVVAFFFYAVYSFGKADERMSISTDIRPAEMVLWSWANVKQSLPKALARGGLIGLSTFVSVALCFVVSRAALLMGSPMG